MVWSTPFPSATPSPHLFPCTIFESESLECPLSISKWLQRTAWCALDNDCIHGLWKCRKLPRGYPTRKQHPWAVHVCSLKALYRKPWLSLWRFVKTKRFCQFGFGTAKLPRRHERRRTFASTCWRPCALSGEGFLPYRFELDVGRIRFANGWMVFRDPYVDAESLVESLSTIGFVAQFRPTPRRSRTSRRTSFATLQTGSTNSFACLHKHCAAKTSVGERSRHFSATISPVSCHHAGHRVVWKLIWRIWLIRVLLKQRQQVGWSAFSEGLRWWSGTLLALLSDECHMHDTLLKYCRWKSRQSDVGALSHDVWTKISPISTTVQSIPRKTCSLLYNHCFCSVITIFCVSRGPLVGIQSTALTLPQPLAKQATWKMKHFRLWIWNFPPVWNVSKYATNFHGGNPKFQLNQQWCVRDALMAN